MTTTTLTTVRDGAIRLSAKPIVQGLIGAILGVLIMAGAWKAYGWSRWYLYGKNEQRISANETKIEADQKQIDLLGANVKAIIAYLQSQEAMKSQGAVK
jgi:hypothetical protein